MKAVPWSYQAKVTRVVDGDTFEVEVDLGFGVFTRETVRLARVNAPELASVDGQNSKLRVANLLGPLPANVVLQTSRASKDRSDNWRRYLAEMWVQRATPVNVSDWLLSEGLAIVYGNK